MTKAEKKAIIARTNDLIKSGVQREIAEILAKAEFDCRVIKTVVNYNK